MVWPLVALTLAALALRLWYSRVNPLLPQFSNADDGDYYQRALRLVITGRYVDNSWLIRPPLHVWLFAACIKITVMLGGAATSSVRLIQAVHAVLGAALVPLGYSLVARLFDSRRAGLIFAAFWALWFPFIDLASTLFSEPLYLFLFTLHLWLLVRYDRAGRRRDLALAGLALGLAALTRSPALYALAFAAPWLLQSLAGGARSAAHPTMAWRGRTAGDAGGDHAAGRAAVDRPQLADLPPPDRCRHARAD